MITVWFIAMWRVFSSDKCFLDFGEGFRGYLISRILMQLCSLELLILCFSTAKGSENRWVHLNLAYICLGPAFSGLWWRISWILNFTCLDAILFTKVAHTLFQHISEKRKPLSLLQSGLWFPRTSIFWTWWRISLILDCTCLDAIMFAKVPQTLFQHFLGKRKTFGLLKSETSLPRISDL